MRVVQLAFKSMINRKTSALLTIFSIGISVALLLSVERVRVEAHRSFTNTLSGTDIIVGARSSPINLLLYSVFHIGNATNNVSWDTYQTLSTHQAVSWAIPVALGDSHAGYRVVGSSSDMFRYFRFGEEQSFEFVDGSAFVDLYDAVLGSEVAAGLDYQVGQNIVLSHGMGHSNLQQHSDKPFKVSGILKPTGTPMDRVILVSLSAIEALHIDWVSGAPSFKEFSVSADDAREMDLQPSGVTAFFVGLKSRVAAFRYQREVNDYPQEAMTAILPGVALGQLWQLVGSAEKALLFISIMVVIACLVGMLTTILTSLNERRREMAILRSVGARPIHIMALMIAEAKIYAILGALLGLILFYLLLFILQPVIQLQWGLFIPISGPTAIEATIIFILVVCAGIMGVLPAWLAYRNSLADGLAIKI